MCKKRKKIEPVVEEEPINVNRRKYTEEEIEAMAEEIYKHPRKIQEEPPTKKRNLPPYRTTGFFDY